MVLLQIGIAIGLHYEHKGAGQPGGWLDSLA